MEQTKQSNLRQRLITLIEQIEKPVDINFIARRLNIHWFTAQPLHATPTQETPQTPQFVMCMCVSTETFIMVDFIKVPKKMPFKRRLELVSAILNRKGEVSVEYLVLGCGVTPHYAMTILKWAEKKYSYAEWDGTDRILFIPGRRESEGNT